MTIASVAASTVVLSSQSILEHSHVFHIARGGAVVAATSAAATASAFLRATGSSVAPTSLQHNSSDVGRGGGGLVSSSRWTPEGASVLHMAVAMSLHYLSYSIARPSTIALFTSATTGFAGNTAAFPLAMAFISPASLLLLLLYGKILQRVGPRGTVRHTTTLCAATLAASGVLVRILQGTTPIIIPLFGGKSIKLLQLVVGALFIFRESYVQLLTSQYWSFMASILTPEQSATWFSPISGLTSATSALSGFGVSSVVAKVGLPGALGLAGLLLLSSLIFTEQAYNLSDAGGFTPADDRMSKNKVQNSHTHVHKEQSLFKKASGLFRRVPVLQALFLEILTGQGLATLLNVCFVTKLSESLPDDTERAGWMGRFFASINVVAMGCQFGVMPRLVMPYVEPRTLWRVMPTVMVVALSHLSLSKDPSLTLISASFLLFKVLEFSVRRLLDEMVYVPLDFESRFLGKEIIGVFGYRFGKSGMSLALSGLTSLYGNFGLQRLSRLTGVVACLWLGAAWNVSDRVLTRAEAQALYAQKKQPS